MRTKSRKEAWTLLVRRSDFLGFLRVRFTDRRIRMLQWISRLLDGRWGWLSRHSRLDVGRNYFSLHATEMPGWSHWKLPYLRSGLRQGESDPATVCGTRKQAPPGACHLTDRFSLVRLLTSNAAEERSHSAKPPGDRDYRASASSRDCPVKFHCCPGCFQGTLV